MPESLDELTGSTDPLIPPPRNPARAPQAIEDLLVSGAKGWVDWVKQPGQQMQGVQPQTPGQWSEEDEFRQQHLATSQYEWGPETASAMVFAPRIGGAGHLTSGAGSKIGQPKMTPVEHDPFMEPVKTYASLLTGASKDNSAFDAIIERLKIDKSIGMNELREVAKQFLGYELGRSKNKTELIQAIVNRQMVIQRQEGRGLNVDRMKEW